MRSGRPCPKFLRWSVAIVGVLGVHLAVYAVAILIYMLVEPAVTGAAVNPYAGIVAFVLVPAAVLIGAGVAWGAYRFWRYTTPAAAEHVTAGAAR